MAFCYSDTGLNVNVPYSFILTWQETAVSHESYLEADVWEAAERERQWIQLLFGRLTLLESEFCCLFKLPDRAKALNGRAFQFA